MPFRKARLTETLLEDRVVIGPMQLAPVRVEHVLVKEIAQVATPVASTSVG